MKKYVDFIYKNRKLLLIFFIILNLTSLLGVLRIRIDPNYDVFMPENSRYREVLNEMNEELPGSEQLIFLVETQNTKISLQTVKDYSRFQRFLENLEGVMHVTGPAPAQVIADDNFIEIDRIKERDLHYVEAYYESLGKLSPVTVKDGKLYGTFEVFPKGEFTNEQIKDIERFLKQQDIKYYISGDIYMKQKIMDYIQLILLFMPPIALLLILTVFRVRMGSMKATFLSVLPAGIGALWTLGLVGWIGNKVSIITVLAPIFTIVIGSANGLHFITHIQDERSNGKGKKESIIDTVKMVGVPLIITCITTVAGFLSLLVMNNASIKELAVFASTGIFLAGAATWYVLPVILSGGVELRKRSDKGKRVISGVIRRLWGVLSLVILVLLLAVSFFGVRKISTEFNMLTVYKDYTDVKKNFEKIMEVNNGSVPISLYIKTEKNPLKPSYAKNIIDLESKLADSKYVGKVISAYDIYAIINSSIIGSKNPVYPGTMSEVEEINTFFEGEDNPTRNLVNVDKRAARVVVFPVDFKNDTLDHISSMVKDFNKKHEDMDVKVTGAQYLMRELNQGMVQNQTTSLALAFFLVFILLFISLRRIKPALISLLPILSTIFILYGFLGLSGISLNVITTTIFGITIGVGIDYAVHFTSVWMSFRKKGYGSDEAAEKAYTYTSRPIITNALGISIGLSALLFSPLKVHLFVSLMMWVAMVSGALLSLSLLPTILRKTA